MLQRALKWLVFALLMNFGMAMAQQEPTLAQVYAVAQAGKLDQAQVMVQQVLISHPNSAKAHYVQSELYARQGNIPHAREALAAAEKVAPGLSFAKPEAVLALRAQLTASPAQAAPVTTLPHASPASTTGNANSWLPPVLLTAGVMVLGYFVFRKKPSAPPEQMPIYTGGLNGPQTFGMGGGAVIQPPYGQPGYGQAAGTGLGGKIMGGVATGLAVGAGVMAAEAIGRNLMGSHEGHDNRSNYANNDFNTATSNADMGGQDFGVNDTGSWDSGDASGDWDN